MATYYKIWRRCGLRLLFSVKEFRPNTCNKIKPLCKVQIYVLKKATPPSHWNWIQDKSLFFLSILPGRSLPSKHPHRIIIKTMKNAQIFRLPLCMSRCMCMREERCSTSCFNTQYYFLFSFFPLLLHSFSLSICFPFPSHPAIALLLSLHSHLYLSAQFSHWAASVIISFYPGEIDWRGKEKVGNKYTGGFRYRWDVHWRIQGKWNVRLRRQFGGGVGKRHFTQHFYYISLQKSITKEAVWNFALPSAAHQVKCNCAEKISAFSNISRSSAELTPNLALLKYICLLKN